MRLCPSTSSFGITRFVMRQMKSISAWRRAQRQPRFKHCQHAAVEKKDGANQPHHYRNPGAARAGRKAARKKNATPPMATLVATKTPTAR
jgi:hypothetical protein